MTQRALLTGSEGFVGRVLARRLHENGWEIVRSDFRADEGVLPCDMGDYAQVKNTLAEAGKITHIFHLAAQTFVPESHKNPAPTFQTNLIGTVNLVQAMQEANPETRLVFIGSADAYGPPQYLPVDEQHPLNPQNPYAISKAAADAYCRYAAKAHGLDIVILRPFNHSGAGQSDDFVLPGFAKQIAAIEAGKQEPVIRVGNLNAARDFSHVEDIAHAYILAAESGISGEAYNVCSGVGHSIQSALDALLQMSAVKIRVEEDPARMRPADVPEVAGSCEKLRTATGWRAERGFDKMLEEILAYWRESLKTLTV